MRVLVTGCTSAQAVQLSHRRSANFAGLLVEQLRAGGHEVTWTEPMVGMPLAQYDHAFVGVSSPLAMGALRAYGALHVAGQLRGSGRLTLFVDAPDPNLVTRGLRSVLGNWPSFTKDFFSNRAGWNAAREPETNAFLRETCEWLASGEWPPTVVPGLPWSDPELVEANLPPGASERVQTVNLDHLLLSRFVKEWTGVPRLREWAYEKTADRKWLFSQSLALPVRELPRNHRVDTDTPAVQQLRESVGLLVGPIRGEVWWTPKIAMSLAVLTPVFTDWHQARSLGPEWALLPGPHETASPEEAASLAIQQFTSFRDAIPSAAEALTHLTQAAGMADDNDRKAVAS